MLGIKLAKLLKNPIFWIFVIGCGLVYYLFFGVPGQSSQVTGMVYGIYDNDEYKLISDSDNPMVSLFSNNQLTWYDAGGNKLVGLALMPFVDLGTKTTSDYGITEVQYKFRIMNMNENSRVVYESPWVSSTQFPINTPSLSPVHTVGTEVKKVDNQYYFYHNIVTPTSIVDLSDKGYYDPNSYVKYINYKGKSGRPIVFWVNDWNQNSPTWFGGAGTNMERAYGIQLLLPNDMTQVEYKVQLSVRLMKGSTVMNSATEHYTTFKLKRDAANPGYVQFTINWVSPYIYS